MLASGAGAFYLAALGEWSLAYTVMALLMAVGMATILLTPEPALILPRVRPGEKWLTTLLVRPFSDFIERCGIITGFLYDCPNIWIKNTGVRLNIATPI